VRIAFPERLTRPLTRWLGARLPERFRARSRAGRRFAALLAALAVVAVGLGGYSALGRSAPGVRQQVLSVTGVPEPDGQPVRLDATLYLPAGSAPEPAVVLAHGFGGSKDDEAADALYLAQHGYVALTYSARGFGRSGGLIHLDSPQYEVKDAERMIDLLATLPEVLKDAPGGVHRPLLRRGAEPAGRRLRPPGGRHRPGDHLEQPRRLAVRPGSDVRSGHLRTGGVQEGLGR
jgi:hypothetical protein